MSVPMRPVGPDDLERIGELEPVLFGAGAWSEAMYAEELRRPDRAYLAAIGEQGELIGWAGISLAETANVMTVGVDPGCQGHGVGSALVAAILAEARTAGARDVILEVRVHDERAQRVYARAGFTPIGIRRRYYQPEGADAVVMRLVLDGGTGRPEAEPADQ